PRPPPSPSTTLFRSLANTGGAHKRDDLAAADRDAGSPQDSYDLGARPVVLLEILADEKLTHTEARPPGSARPHAEPETTWPGTTARASSRRRAGSRTA